MRHTRVGLRGTGGTWFDPPPPKKKFMYCQTQCRVPGFPTDKPVSDPYWLDDHMTGAAKYYMYGPSMSALGHMHKSWQSDEAKGVPKMPPTDHFGNQLIPRDELSKFMPDIFIDGLADEIQGNLRTMGKHIVPHQFHEFYDESLVTERSWGPQNGKDRSRHHTWRANVALYLQRHHYADDMQRKMVIGDAEANDKHQDADDVEYEAEIMAAIRNGDIETACTTYKKLLDPPKNWEVYVGLARLFAERGLLADAVALYDEMQILKIDPNGEMLEHMVDAAVAAEHPLRVVWAVGESRRNFAASLPQDAKARIASKAAAYLLDAEPVLAARVYRYMKKDGLTAIAEIEDKAAALRAKAAELGIMPPSYPTGVHAHRLAATLPADAGAAPPARPAGLAEEDVARLEALLDVEDPVMPYFKKSSPNHALQPGIVCAFRYETASGGARTYPSSRRRGITGGQGDPQMRVRFRWNGPGTRMVGGEKDAEKDVAPELWL